VKLAERAEPSFAARFKARCDAEYRRGGQRCLTCGLPKDVLTVVREHRKAGVPNSVLARSLRAEGFKIADSSLSNHFREHE
jgi:hypothetical protein